VDAINIAESVCQHCGVIFRPRRASGGTPQRFCSTTCRYAYRGQRAASVQASVDQRGSSVESNVSSDIPNEHDQSSQRAASVQPACSTLGTATADAEQPVEAKGVEFEWNDDENIAAREQRLTAIYWNAGGDITIRQQGDLYEDDVVIVISRNNVRSFLDKLIEIASTPPCD
jgi:hypothetical protein